MPRLKIAAGCLIAIALIAPASAQPPIPTISPNLERSAAQQTVSLTLPEVINLVLQSNRELKNAALDRIVQRQELKQAESRFDPTFTPNVSVGVTQSLSTAKRPSPRFGTFFTPTTSNIGTAEITSSSQVGSFAVGNTELLTDRTTVSRSAQATANLLTRIGTQFSLIIDPLAPDKLNLTISQPLLRGFGKAVNQAPVQVARLNETKNSLALRQTLITRITDASAAYRTLIERQEFVRIQERSLISKRRQLEVIRALVAAGRKAKVDLVDAEQSIADTERLLLEARNNLTQANSNLLKLIDTDESFTIVVSPESVEALLKLARSRSENLQLDNLLKTAYLSRPDYLQSKIDIETEKLNLRVAQDEKRWGLNLQSNISLGETSQTAAGLVLSRTFGAQAPETEFQRRRIGVLKNQNRLGQLTDVIRTEVADQLRTIESTQNRIGSAKQAREFAERQLAIAQERFKRGLGGITIFEVIQKEDALATAQNNELVAKLDFFESAIRLDQTLGVTLDTWQPYVDASQLLK